MVEAVRVVVWGDGIQRVRLQLGAEGKVAGRVG